MTTDRQLPMIRALTLVAIAAMALGILATGASAQQPPPYPPQPGEVAEPTVTVTTPGAIVRVRGRDWGPGTTVQIVSRGTTSQTAGAAAVDEPVLGAATVASDGTFTADVDIPADAEEGDLTLVAKPVDGGTSGDADGTQAGTERPMTLTVTNDEALASAATTVEAEPPVAILTAGNAVIAVLVLLGGAALLLGPVRRRRVAQP